MGRKKIDNRLRVLIEQGMHAGHRSMFVVVGDKGRDQVPILHHMLTKAAVKARPSVLWCFKKELGFSSHRKKRMKQLQKKMAHDNFDDANGDNPFELFLAATQVRYCYYKETHKILGQTFGMCVLQDFEALTPNLLARTVETVEGGGVIVLMLKTVDSLRQLFTLSMDVHARYRTEAHQQVAGRFNERFILSLATNTRCIVVDDQLHILPLSSHVKRLADVTPAPPSAEEALGPEQRELQAVKDKFAESQPTGSLLNLCKTLDQAQALLEFVDAITDKKLDRTVSLTAARGRGKSAALGLAVAAAVGFGYSNIFVTSPSPENLHTLFDFVFKGFDAMQYEEHTDYDLVQSTNPEFNNAVVRVNVHEEKNNHRQTIQYLHPSDGQKLGQAELVVIDEAAAIPLPLVKDLLGPYLVFMSSTINGYEGTGRSLSLKLLDQLRQQSNPMAVEAQKSTSSAAAAYRQLKEVTLNESIRYRPGDAVEDWLNRLLCLDLDKANSSLAASAGGCPLPKNCELFYINRDTLFSFHKASEAFLQRIMSLFVSSHYKNSPNDLQMMSDAPAHHLFCLLDPSSTKQGTSLPEVLCVVQVCLEGEISKSSIMHGLSQGKRASGDLIPWTMAQQYQDDNFPSLSGARVVRIATNPKYQRMGYGSRAMDLLRQYYEMRLAGIDEGGDESSQGGDKMATLDEDDVSLLQESLAPRSNLPPLLLELSRRKPERLDYLGVSFGLTQNLLRFWKRCGFAPTYLRQTTNDLTGEHTTVMMRVLDNCPSPGWLPAFWTDFRRRVISLLGLEAFRKYSPALGLSILSNKTLDGGNSTVRKLTAEELSRDITSYDLHRLEKYSNNMADYHLVTDLLPHLGRIYFLRQLGADFRVSATQQAILVGLGLQFKTVDVLAKELELPASQLLGQFNQLIRKLTKALKSVQEQAIADKLGVAAAADANPLKAADAPKALASMDDELSEAAADLRRRQRESSDALKQQDFSNFRIKGSEEEWNRALGGKGGVKTLVSVKSGEKKRGAADHDDDENGLGGKKPKKKKKDKRA